LELGEPKVRSSSERHCVHLYVMLSRPSLNKIDLTWVTVIWPWQLGQTSVAGGALMRTLRLTMIFPFARRIPGRVGRTLKWVGY